MSDLGQHRVAALPPPAPLPRSEAVMWGDEPAQTRLEKMIADLDGYIERRAAQLASPQIEAARADAVERIRRARHVLLRQDDLVTELRKQLVALERQLERAREVTSG